MERKEFGRSAHSSGAAPPSPPESLYLWREGALVSGALVALTNLRFWVACKGRQVCFFLPSSSSPPRGFIHPFRLGRCVTATLPPLFLSRRICLGGRVAAWRRRRHLRARSQCRRKKVAAIARLIKRTREKNVITTGRLHADPSGQRSRQSRSTQIHFLFFGLR